MDTANVHVYVCKDGPEGLIDDKISTQRQNIRKYDQGEDGAPGSTGRVPTAGNAGSRGPRAACGFRLLAPGYAPGSGGVPVTDMTTE
ncbi:hypothetical protein [Saccharopolyspora sp. NPDC050642]|uniref:hypothetical protein n=1 Tax=Saccharopolyspora sp. NPDC050642 TaxID=3157099 RepID=UPI003406F416